MNRTSTFKSYLSLLAVLLVGALIGALLTSHFQKPHYDYDRRDPNGASNFILKNLTNDLKLSPDQQNLILTIIQNRLAEIKALNRQIEPQKAALRIQTQQEIRNQLSPDQQVIFNQLVEAYSSKLLFITGSPSAKPTVPQ